MPHPWFVTLTSAWFPITSKGAMGSLMAVSVMVARDVTAPSCTVRTSYGRAGSLDSLNASMVMAVE